MTENAVKQATVAVRLTSSRAPRFRGTETDGKDRQSSGGEGEVCFGAEWLDDWDGDEALLHEAMDALENGLESNSTLDIQNIKTDNSESEEVSRKICSCQNPSHSTSASSSSTWKNASTPSRNHDQSHTKEESSDSERDIQDSECKDVTINKDSPESTCEKCCRPIVKRSENGSEIDLNSLPKKKAKFTMDPLRQYKGKYLWVSDLTAQAWCERQLLYEISFEGPVEILETEAMKVGTEMHLKRELEVHTIKQIAVKTKEDKWAIKFLNILSAVNQLLLGGGASRCVVREMPIFGKPFQNGIFVVGVIDEIRYNSRDQLEVVEFKTRAKSRTLPSAAQRKTHKLQVMLYKQLFDEAVSGLLKKETIIETIGLDPDASVNDEIAAHALGMNLALPKFGDYLDAMLERFQFLPKIDSLAVEYSSQDDKAPFAIDEYAFDPVWLKGRLEHYNAFWDGSRQVEGVDVEEVWKCNFCSFQDGCDWREKMHEKCLSRKSVNRVQIEFTK